MEASTPKKNQNTKEDNHDLDLDFEEAQALFEKEIEKNRQRELSKDKRERDSNHERSHHRSRDDHYHSRHSHHSHHRRHSRSRPHRHSRSRSHSRERYKEKLQVEHTIEEARRQALVAKRYDCTVLMYSLAKTVNERKIFDFFCKANVGRIIDIKLIRDPKTGKSKNCSYVEFESQEVSMLAIGLSGAELEGQPVQIVPSQAEKNRHAAAAKFKKDQLKEQQRIHLSSATDQIDLTDAPMKIYVGGLTENLADITENDLHNIFEFGDIDSIELHRDPITGKSKGFAFIQFHRASQARQAIAAMNGFNYKGKSLKVGEANENNTFIQHDENIDGRNELMAKLSKVSNTITSMNNTATILESIDTSCIILTNLFNLNDERFITDEFFEEDLIEDVKEQCENFGRIEKIWIDKNSQGNIWIKYDKQNDPKSAFKAMMGLQGKIYDNRPIIVKIIPESLFNATVKMS